jgi:signal transduction histidine kinase
MKLVVLNGEMAGIEFPLGTGEITLGRRSDNDICLPLDLKISRSHARLVREGDNLLLEDLGSANGTYVGQRRIYEPTPLQVGDRFRIGRTWLEVAAEQPSDEAARQVVLVESDHAQAGAPEGVPAEVVFSLDAAHPHVHEADVDEARRRLTVLLEFGQSLGSILDLAQLLRAAAERILEVLPAEQVSLLLVDRQTGDVVPRVALSRTGELPEGELRISRRMITAALEQRLAVLTTDATQDARFSDAQSVHDLHIRSAICAPMVVHGDAIGVIYLTTSSATHVFSEPDVHLVAGIASEVAVAAENARLYTELREAYDQLKQTQDQLVRNERVATVGMLAASIAHDMANIVSPLKPFVEMLLAGQKLDDEARDVVKRQTERLVTLCERLLSFSRNRETHLEPANINEVVDTTLCLVRTELAHRGVKLVLDLMENPPAVPLDATQMERAVLNLIINAAEALENTPKAQIVVRTAQEDTDLLLSVQDNGPGIPLDVQQRLCEPFFTTKQTGTGLGLYSTRRIVEEEHGGSLEIDSLVGQGTTITIRLPIAADAQQIPAAEAEAR